MQSVSSDGFNHCVIVKKKLSHRDANHNLIVTKRIFNHFSLSRKWQHPIDLVASRYRSNALITKACSPRDLLKRRPVGFSRQRESLFEFSS